MTLQLSKTDRYRGSLLGLAAGDAVGAAVEFQEPGSFEPLQDLVGGGPFDLQAGQWTDDTSMALCLAESLLNCRGFHPVDQLERYVKWYRQGYLSSTGVCFDIGNTVREALERFEMSREPFCGSISRKASGNGSLMRLAPVPLFFAANPQEAIIRSGDSSLTTHGSLLTVDACRYYSALILGALQGASKEQLLSARYSPVDGFWEKHYLAPEIDEIALGSYKRRQPPDIKGSGYVVQSLEAALWAFSNSSSFAEGCLLAANLGDDSDTTAAIYGQLAGAYYGVQGIPQHWLDKLAMYRFIEETADHVLRASEEVSRSG